MPVAQYLQRLEAVRATLSRARTGDPLSRGDAVVAARSTLRLTDHVTSPSGAAVAVDDTRLIDRLDTTDAGLDDTIARLDARIALVSRVGSPAVDPARADDVLRASLRQTTGATGISVVDFLMQLLVRFLSGLRGPQLDIGVLWTAVGLIGVAVIVFIVATLGRGTRERLRREILAADPEASDAVDPVVHLRTAEAAVSAGRSREAIHALFLYVITTLASREVIRYDPSFTDRELLVATAAIPHADALRDLVAIYERSWFGIREPSVDEARRARELALRVAP